jgi:hypothetical protein
MNRHINCVRDVVLSLKLLNISTIQTLMLHKTETFYIKQDMKYICINKTNLMHCLSLEYFVYQPLHVSGLFIAHQQEVHCIYIYTTIGTYCSEKRII